MTGPPDRSRTTEVFSEPAPDPAREAAHAPIPRDWDRYEVIGYLGAGGMGHVFRAVDRTLRRPVALKFLRSSGAGGVARFLREARAQAAVEHDNVCRVYEVGEIEGHPYIAMQLIEGQPLDQATEGSSREAIVALVIRAARALHAAHRTGLIHRDVKPANMLVTRGEDGTMQPVLVDFGLARELGAEGAMATTTISGTPAYMAPEQARGEPVDRRADVYALGAVLYELLVGHPPIRAPNLALALREVVESAPVPLRQIDRTIPRELEIIVSSCLEKDPAQRYPSARDLADDLQRFLDGEPITARGIPRWRRVARAIARRRLLAVALAVVVVALGGAAGIAIDSRIQSQKAAAAAQWFAGELVRLETEARLAAMLPTERPGLVRARLLEGAARFEAEMQRRGPAAKAAGHAALGRVALLAGDLERAREELEIALELAPAPSLRADLGEVLARSWAEVQLGLPGIADSGVAAAERERLERELRDPALELLRAGVPSGEGDLVRARLALCAGDTQEAARLARQTAERDPWRFEARTIVAEAELVAGGLALQEGQVELATRHLASARGELDLALDIAPAALEARLVGCHVEHLETVLANRGAALEPSRLETLVAVCERARELDPGALASTRAAVGALSVAAEIGQRRGWEVEEWLERGLAQSTAADQLLDPELWRSRARLLATAADRAGRRGADQGELLAAAQAALERAAAAAPSSPEIANSLGTLSYRQALLAIRHAEDSGPALDRAIAALTRAGELATRSAGAHTNLGSALVLQAERLARVDPDGAQRSLDRAVAAFDRALEVDPQRPAFLNNRGNAFLTRAEISIDQGEDPRPALRQAVASYGRALEARPGYSLAAFNLAWAHRLAADETLHRGGEARGELERARRAVAASRAADPADASTAALEARIEVVAMLLGDPAAAGRARETIARGRGLDPTLVDLDLAEAELHYAETVLRGEDPTVAATVVEQVASRSLELRPLRALRNPAAP